MLHSHIQSIYVHIVCIQATYVIVVERRRELFAPISDCSDVTTTVTVHADWSEDIFAVVWCGVGR